MQESITVGRRIFSDDNWFIDAKSIGFSGTMNRIYSLFDHHRQESEKCEAVGDFDTYSEEEQEVLQSLIGPYLFKETEECLGDPDWSEVQI